MADIWKHLVKRPFQQVGGTFFCGLALLILPFFSRRGIVRLSCGLANWGWTLARRERNIALANLDLAYGGRLSYRRKQAIVRRSFQTFILMVLDLFWFSFRSRERLLRFTRIDTSLQKYLVPGGRIFVTAHFGNWELLGQASAMTGYRLASVAKPIENFLLDRLLIRIRQKSGQVILPQTGALRRMIGLIRDGMGVALLLDQDTSPQKGGLGVDFFGKPVTISAAAANFSRKFKVPVIMTFGRPIGGTYRFYALDPAFTIAENESEVEFTQRLAHATEAEIRRHPGCWLWMYKRWKRYFPGQAPTPFHFYATR